MDQIELNLELEQILGCKKPSHNKLCDKVKFEHSTLKKITNYVDFNIKNKIDAENIFLKIEFVNFIIDEDQISPNLGNDGFPILQEFNRYIVPTYLELFNFKDSYTDIKYQNIDYEDKIINLYRNAEINFSSINDELKNNFDIIRFFKSIDDVYKKIIDQNYSTNEYEIDICNYYFKKLEEHSELLLDCSTPAHAISIIIKKIYKNYEVTIINTNPGSFSENIF